MNDDTALVPIPRTAVVPAAGLGTRFLPATKTVPKELLPVVDTPGIELVAAEAAEAGAERLIIVTSEGKDGVVAHFVEDLVLEGTLEARGKTSMLEKVRRAPALIKVESVVQAEPLGLGHAVGCVEASLAPDEDAIAVLLPDDLVLPTGVLETMSKVRAKRGGSVLCAIEVPPEEISAYGVFDVEPVPDTNNPNVLRVKGMVREAQGRGRAVAVRRRGSVRAGPGDLRCAAPGAARGGRRDPADRRDRAADQRGPSGACRRASRLSTRPGKSRRVPQGCG